MAYKALQVLNEPLGSLHSTSNFLRCSAALGLRPPPLVKKAGRLDDSVCLL